MNEHTRLARLTNLLYGLAVVLFAGTIVELLAAKHVQEPLQLLPFVLCGLGVVAVTWVWRAPRRATVQALRGLMVVTAAASLLGVWKHIEGNAGFIQEMHPTTSGLPLLLGALTGRAPLLASGALAVAAAIAVLATFAAGWEWDGSRAEQPEHAPALASARPVPSMSAR